MQIYDAKVNHLTNPLGFRMTRTVFSWKVQNAASAAQSWARIRVAEDAEMTKLLFDSGEDPNADSLGCSAALPLVPRKRYYWTVTVHADPDEEAQSDVQWFETGKREEAWQGRWITCDSTEKRHPFFSKEIVRDAGKDVTNARLYICGLGLYEAFYNGERIGSEYMTPYSNDYNEWLQVQTYDVTNLLGQDGTLSVLLGNGWYKGRFGFLSHGEDLGYYGNDWKLIAELHIDYTDGSSCVVGTDESWTVTRSAITFSNIYDGEWRDDTLPALPAEQAAFCEAPKGVLTDRMSLPVTVHEVLKPAALIDTPSGERVFDLGQEITGIFSLRVSEPAGTEIHIQTGEILQGGNFYNANLRSAKSEYFYISDGTEMELVPHFTFFGYRYVKVSGVSHLSADDFRGIVLHSDLEPIGAVETGHELVNRLISNVRWGMKGNFLDVPTDCPQRDERMGWTGDAQVFSPTAMYLTDAYAFYAKFLYDMAQEQRSTDGMVPDVIPSCGVTSTATVWGDACCIIPWNLYLFYGDKSILEDQFDSMKAWVDYIRRTDGDNHAWRYVHHYGDWLALDNPAGGAEQVYGATDEEFIANLYYAVSAGIVAKAARVLGDEAAEREYSALSDAQFSVVKREYYSATGRPCIKTQTAMLLTLKYHLSDNEELVKQMLNKLFAGTNGKLATGFVGTPLLCNVLSDNGMDDQAMKLLLNESYPGWLYEVKLGATTVWERWNSLLEDGTISGISMNSMNHYAYGSILEWIFRHVAGINTLDDAPGLRRVAFMPTLDLALGHVEASYDSAAGRYAITWALEDASHVRITVTVPFGCTASLQLPLAPEEVYADADNPMFADVSDGVCHLTAGTYQVSYALTRPLRGHYTMDTSIGEILENAEIAEQVEKILPLSNVPEVYRSLPLRVMLEKFGGHVSEQQIRKLEAILA